VTPEKTPPFGMDSAVCNELCKYVAFVNGNNVKGLRK